MAGARSYSCRLNRTIGSVLPVDVYIANNATAVVINSVARSEMDAKHAALDELLN